MRPVGVGLASLGPMGVVGLRMMTFWPFFGGGDGLLLGEKLGALVVADHVFEGDGRVFVDDHAVGAEVHGGHAGRVDEALHAGLAGHAQQFARAVDVGAVHGLRIANPEAVIGGHVDHGIAAGEAGSQRFRLRQIADEGVAGNAFEIGEIAGLADQHAQIGALGG